MPDTLATTLDDSVLAAVATETIAGTLASTLDDSVLAAAGSALFGRLSGPIDKADSDTVSINFTTASYSALEPVPTTGPALAPSIWYRFTESQVANFTATASGFASGATLELFSGPAAAASDDLTFLGTSTAGVLTTTASVGVVYYLRALPATTTYTESGTVVWASAARTGGGLMLSTATSVDSTPTSMSVTVSNGVPSADVAFTVDGGSSIGAAVLDETGQIIATSVMLPSLTVGTHTLTATTSTDSGNASFDVLVAAVAYPTTRVADTAPAPVAQTGVVKWVLQDPTSGGANLIFAINPSKMSAPHAARVFATEHTTAPDGQALTFEGGAVGVDWALEGACRTQAFHDSLETFLAMPRRVYLIDHLSRAWTVTLESINWTRLPEAYNDWAFSYQLKALILAGPVQL